MGETTDREANKVTGRAIVSDAFQRIQDLIAEDRCVILDGGIATELQEIGAKKFQVNDASLWGTGALYHAPHAALEVHRRYVAAGCDIISTNTWGIMSAPEMEALMICINPFAPAEERAFGSKRLSWCICAAIRRQSNP